MNLYGDSYGTYFAQVFALRHPQRLRSLVLDGAYPLDGPDYAVVSALCAGDARQVQPRLRALGAVPRARRGTRSRTSPRRWQALRAQPFAAQARCSDGRSARLHRRRQPARDRHVRRLAGVWPRCARWTPRRAPSSPATTLPLLRLMAETAVGSVDSRDPTHSPAHVQRRARGGGHVRGSAADLRHELCRRHSASRQRDRADREAQARRHPTPMRRSRSMSTAACRSTTPSSISACSGRRAPPARRHCRWCPDASYPDVPVLVVSGELDNMTSVADGAAAAARFPHAHHVIIANGFHVNALPHARSECGAQLVRRFMAELSTGDESCAAAVPPVRLVPRFAGNGGRTCPGAGAERGNEAADAELRVVSAALLTARTLSCAPRRTDRARAWDCAAARFSGRSAPARAITSCCVRCAGPRTSRVSGDIDWPGRSGSRARQLDAELRRRASAASSSSQWPEGVDRRTRDGARHAWARTRSWRRRRHLRCAVRPAAPEAACSSAACARGASDRRAARPRRSPRRARCRSETAASRRGDRKSSRRSGAAIRPPRLPPVLRSPAAAMVSARPTCMIAAQ